MTLCFRHGIPDRVVRRLWPKYSSAIITPGGKLPVTFYRSNDDLPDFLDYSMDNRTYRYFRGKAQYPFGHGLSYTSFDYGKGRLSKSSMKSDGKVTLTVPVTNTGDRKGDEIVQVSRQGFGLS